MGPGSAEPFKDASAVASTRPKLAVFLPVFGIPSEIWAVRQSVDMKAFAPVLIAWEQHPAAPADQFGLEIRYFDLPWASNRTLWRRASRRLGCVSACIDVEEGRRIAPILREVEADANLCHFLWTGVRVTNALAGSSAAGVEPAPKSTPIIWHAHGRDVSKSLREHWFQSSVVRAIPRAAGVVAVESHQLKRLQTLGHPREKGRLIPCGVPMADFGMGPMPRRRTKAIRFISVGRVSPEKGVLHTIRAFAAVCSQW